MSEKSTNETTVEFEGENNSGVEEMVVEKLSAFEKIIPGLVDKLVDDNVKIPPRPSPAKIAASSSSAPPPSPSHPLPTLPIGRETMTFQVCFFGEFYFICFYSIFLIPLPLRA